MTVANAIPNADIASHPRWGQLTYASFDASGHDRGGWQVKQTRGRITQEETTWLLARVVAQLIPRTPLPEFPTPQELTNLPRRLLYSTDWPHRAGFWHTVPAGFDGTGRPGNVFAHTLLDRDPAHADALRPIQLWRSADWLCPYGARAVAEASLGSRERPLDGPDVRRADVLAFLSDPTEWRFGVLAALLDAVVEALNGGRRVVLGTHTPDDAARWIAAVSYLTDAATSRRIGFSTYERVNALNAVWSKGVLIAAVPTQDIADEARVLATDASVVVIDTTQDVALGQWQGVPHVTSTQSEIAVTPWSVLAQLVLQEPHGGPEIVASIDDLVSANTMTGHAGLALAHALSKAGGSLGDDAAAEIRWLVDGFHLQPHTQVAIAVDAEVQSNSEVGRTTADAWTHVTAGPVATESALLTYVQRAVRDVGWLTADTAAPLPEGYRPPHHLASIGSDAVQTAVDLDYLRSVPLVSHRSAEILRPPLRLLDFLVRAGFKGAVDQEGTRSDAVPAAADLVEAVVIPLLLSDHDLTESLRQVGPLDPHTKSAFLRPMLYEARSDPRRRARFADGVAAWLDLPADPTDSGPVMAVPAAEPAGSFAAGAHPTSPPRSASEHKQRATSSVDDAYREWAPPASPAAHTAVATTLPAPALSAPAINHRPSGPDDRGALFELAGLRRDDPGYEGLRPAALAAALLGETLPPPHTLSSLAYGERALLPEHVATLVDRFGAAVPGEAVEHCLLTWRWDDDVARLVAAVLDSTRSVPPAVDWAAAAALALLRDVGSTRPLRRHNVLDVVAAVARCTLASASAGVRQESAGTIIGSVVLAALVEHEQRSSTTPTDEPGTVDDDPARRYFSGTAADRQREQVAATRRAATLTDLPVNGPVDFWPQLAALGPTCDPEDVTVVLEQRWLRDFTLPTLLDATLFAHPDAPGAPLGGSPLARLAALQTASGRPPLELFAFRVLSSGSAVVGSLKAHALRVLGGDSSNPDNRTVEALASFAMGNFENLVAGRVRAPLPRLSIRGAGRP